VHALGVVESDARLRGRLEHALRLLVEHDGVEDGRVHVNLLLLELHVVLVEQTVVEQALLPVDIRAQVSRLREHLHQPLDHGQNLRVVETLDLMGLQLVGASHVLHGLNDLFGETNFLTEV